MKKILLALLLIVAPAQAIDTDVIARPPSKYNEEFLRENVQAIFTTRIRAWPNGERIQVFILPRDSIYTRYFCLKYLHMTPERYFATLAARQSYDQGSVPTLVDNQSDLIFKVINTKGSVGYADSSVVANLNDHVVIIRNKDD